MPNKPLPRKVEVDFDVDADYLIKGLTSDVSTIECVYDLIDNSIDAARNEILGSSKCKKDDFGLPASYSGFEIRISFSESNFEISDNCGGISETELTTRSFRTGAKSKHRFGIGHFGVGLNRSVFKLGSRVELRTDDSKTLSQLEFTETKVRNLKKVPIEAVITSTTGKKFNVLRITELRAEVANELAKEKWRSDVSKLTQERYGRFVSKGLKILIGEVAVESFGPLIRNDGSFPIQSAILVLSGGVKFFYTAGMHSGYHLGEGGIAKNRKIAPEYGWYIVCNDRIIRVADRGPETGWTTVWHNEYSGFVGWAHYVSEDPSKLPWDSKKTGINTHSAAHVETAETLKEVADNFRTANRKRIKKLDKTLDGKDERKAVSGDHHVASRDGAGLRIPPPKNRLPHSSSLDNVFFDCDVVSRQVKISSLVIEAAGTPILNFPYRAAFMIRALFEQALNDYLRRHRHAKEIKDHWITEIKKKRALTAEQERTLNPTLEQTLIWVINNQKIWPVGQERTCGRGCENFKGHLPHLNGAVHETGRLIDEVKVRKIRDDVVSALVVILTH